MKPYTGQGTVSYPRNKNYSSFDVLVAERQGLVTSNIFFTFNNE